MFHRSTFHRSYCAAVAFALAAMAASQDTGIYLFNETPGTANFGKSFRWKLEPDGKFSGESTVDFGSMSILWNSVYCAGVGDFDGDGWSDVLWHDVENPSGTSNLMITYFHNGSVQRVLHVATALPEGFRVKGVSDFDGDGTPDLLVQRSSADLEVWKMGGTDGDQVAAVIALGSPMIGGTDRLSGFADVNGDGMADVILHRTQKDLVYWESTGTGVVKNGNQNARIPLLTLHDKSRLQGYGRVHVIGTANVGWHGRTVVLREHKDGGFYSVWMLHWDGVGDYPAANQVHLRNTSFKKPYGVGRF